MNHPIEVGMIISEETDRWLQQKGRKNEKKKKQKKTRHVIWDDLGRFKEGQQQPCKTN